jgi:hypothetical protein
MTDAYPNANHFIGSSTLDSDAAAIAAARDAGQARVEARQAQSAQFIVIRRGCCYGIPRWGWFTRQ